MSFNMTDDPQSNRDQSAVDEKTSHRMSKVRAADTKPEMTVRRLLHGLGYRYRLHVKDLPRT